MKKNTPPTDSFSIDLSGLGGGSGTSISYVDLSKKQFNVSGLNLQFPAGTDVTKVNGTELYNALVKTATTDPSSWLPIKYALAQSNFYATTPNFTPGWQSEDKRAVEFFLQTLVHKNTNLSAGEAETPMATFLAQTQNMAKQYGGAATRTKIQNVTIPNELDLNYIAKNALQKVLGSATKAQVDAFTKSFQSDIMAVARANSVEPQMITPKMTAPMSQNPRQADAVGTPQAMLKQNFVEAQKTPTVQLRATQSPPDANVAAQDFARKIDPNAAAVHGLNDAMGAWFNSLAKGNQ